MICSKVSRWPPSQALNTSLLCTMTCPDIYPPSPLSGLDQGEDTLGRWPASAGPIPAAFGTLMDYLAREGLSPAQKQALAGAAFVPVANSSRLVEPSRLFTRIKEDLAPFAYEVPVEYAKYTDLLRELGAGAEPSAGQLHDALCSFERATRGVHLNVNQALAVVRLLKYLSTAFLGSGADAVACSLPVLTSDSRLQPVSAGVLHHRLNC